MWLVKMALRRPYSVADLLHRDGAARHPVDALDADGRAAGHRHPGRDRRLQLPGPVGRRRPEPHAAGRAARLLDHRRRHRAHGGRGDRRRRDHQDLLRARHQRRLRDRADHGADPAAAAVHAAGHGDAEHPAVQRLEHSRRADDAVELDAVGAGDLRLRAELPAPPAVHHPGAADAAALRRLGQAGQRRHRSRAAGRQAAVAAGRRHRGARVQRHPAGRLGAHRPAAVRRARSTRARPATTTSTRSRSSRSTAPSSTSATSRSRIPATRSRRTSCASTGGARPISRSSRRARPRRWWSSTRRAR